MRTLTVVFVLGIVLAACTEDDLNAVPAPGRSGNEVVVFEAGPTIAQCAPPVISVPQSAAKLSAVGIRVRYSGCGVRTGVAYAAVCGAGTGQIILHNIPDASLSAAQAAGFQPAATLVDAAHDTGWRRVSCEGHSPFLDLARQSANCAQTRNRLLFIDSANLDVELVLLDQAGTCADASYRQMLYGETVDDVLCSNAQSIAGPRKNCPVSSYAGLFDTIIANLDKTDLGLGDGYVVEELLVSR